MDPKCCPTRWRHPIRTVYYNIPPRLPADIIADAQRTLVIRGWRRELLLQPEDPLSYLQQTSKGLQDLGYQFVSPQDV